LTATAPTTSKPALQKHQIAAGDSLWKIARKYKVTIEAIRAANHLESDKFREGRTLIIPARSATE
jgi:LysM repeat protein